MRQITHQSPLPWPHVWDQMQWQIAAWMSKYGPCASVRVVWNQTRLIHEIAPAMFQSSTAEFCEAVRQQLGSHFDWQFEHRELEQPHRLHLGLMRSPTQEIQT